VNILTVISNISGILGVLFCLIAVAIRMIGMYYVAGFEALTLFNGGVAMMVFSCLAKLHLLQQK